MSDTVRNSPYDQKVTALLVIYEQNRQSIMDMIGDLEILKDKLDTIFPEGADVRHMRFFEEKIKAISSFFNVLLDMRKEINKSIRDEIDIRRKVEGKDAEIDLESLLDVRQATRKLESFKKNVDKMKDKRAKKMDPLELPENVRVPGINASAEGL